MKAQSKSSPKQTNRTIKRPRAVLYARVSTEEQTRSVYPSCESQIQELRDYCEKHEIEVVETIHDPGYSAGSLRRPGLSKVRQMIHGSEVEVLICTWYDRLARSRDFYTIDNELKANQVELITIHDRIDRASASGRFMESVLVAAKTHERDQTSEKVRTKMRQRRERGYCNNGQAPFGFTRDPATDMLSIDEGKRELVNQMFRLYVENGSDTAVRTFLESHGIQTPRGKSNWTLGTIRSMLTNRRYVGEIEINPRNKEVACLQEEWQYRIVEANHGGIVPRDLFDLATAIRDENAARHPNAGGWQKRDGRVPRKANGYAVGADTTDRDSTIPVRGVGRKRNPNQAGHLFFLQDLLTCSHCGRIMSPHYVHKKPGGQRKTESFVHHYVCVEYRKHGKKCDHANRILARKAETWILERIKTLFKNRFVVDKILDAAHSRLANEQLPDIEALGLAKSALQKNESDTQNLMAAIRSGQVQGAMLSMLNDDANRLHNQKRELLGKIHRLEESLRPIDARFNADEFANCLRRFAELIDDAHPDEIRQLVSLLVDEIIWSPNGRHRIRYLALSELSLKSRHGFTGNAIQVDSHRQAIEKRKTPLSEENEVWFDITQKLACPVRRSVNPVSLVIPFKDSLPIFEDAHCLAK